MGTPESKEQVVGVLRNLSGGSVACKVALDKGGVIPAVVAMMTKQVAHQVQANLCVVLYNLCKESPDRRVAATNVSALPVLVQLLGSGVAQVQQEAADTMRILVSDNRARCSAAISA